MSIIKQILPFLIMAVVAGSASASHSSRVKANASESDLSAWQKQLANSSEREQMVKKANSKMESNWNSSVPLLQHYHETRLKNLSDSLKAHQSGIADFLNRPLQAINRDTLESLIVMLDISKGDKALLNLGNKAILIRDILRLRDKNELLLQMPFFQVELVDTYQDLKKIDTKSLTQAAEVDAEIKKISLYQSAWRNLQKLTRTFADSVASNASKYSPLGVNPGSKQKKEAYDMLHDVLASDTTLLADKISSLPMIAAMMELLEKDAKSNPLYFSENQQTVMALLDLYAPIDINVARKRLKDNSRLSIWDDIKDARLANQATENQILRLTSATEVYRSLISQKPDWTEIEKIWDVLDSPYDAESIGHALREAESLCAGLAPADVALIQNKLIAPLNGYGKGIDVFADVINEVNNDKLVKFYRSKPGTSAEQQRTSAAKVKEVAATVAKRHSADVAKYISTVPYLKTLWDEYLKFTPSAQNGTLTQSPVETQILSLKPLNEK